MWADRGSRSGGSEAPGGAGAGAAFAAPGDLAAGRAHGAAWEGTLVLVLSLALLAFGMVAVYSASSMLALRLGLPDHHFVVRQGAGGLIGLALLALFSRVDYRWLRPLAWPILLAVVLLLLVIVLPGTTSIAPVVNGARRWLMLGSFVIQPSEVAKLGVIVWTAALAVKKQHLLTSLSRGLLPFLVVWGTIEVLVFLQPDLSSALLILLLALLVVFAAGARIGHLLLLGLVGLPVLWGRVETVGYQFRRMAAFLDPSHDPAGLSYQAHQSLVAMGSGGLLGQGLGRGQQKFGFLPEPHNDFIFAMIGEEWGFLGVAIVVSFFACIAFAGYRIARQAPDTFGFLLAVGVTNLIVVQALLHMAVNLALIPTTGLTLPFVSYGRSSLIVCLAAVGILLSVARATRLEATPKAGRSRERKRSRGAMPLDLVGAPVLQGGGAR